MIMDAQNWADNLRSRPVAPLGLIVMPGAEKLGDMVNYYLKQWTVEPENHDELLLTFPGDDKDTFEIKISCPRFGSGEAKGMIEETIRGYDLYIISDVTNYSIEYEMYGKSVPMSPDDHYMNLRRIIAATCDKGFRVNVIMPYLYEGRQHKRATRESLDCAMMLQDLIAMGVKNIITFDAHDPRVLNSVPNMSVENVQPTYQMIKAILNNVPDLQIDKNHMMVISPDEGAANRNIYYSTMLGLNMGMFYKRRDYSRIVNGRNPIVAHEYLGEPVEGMDIIIADDILATGDSMLDLARQLKGMKCGRIIMVVTFGLFTFGIQAFREAYEAGIFDYLVLTNLSYLPEEYLEEPWIIQANLAKYTAYFIATLNHDRSVSKLLNPTARIEKILERYRNGELEIQKRLHSGTQLKFE